MLDNKINETEALRGSTGHSGLHAGNTRDKDLKLFVDIAKEKGQTTETDGKLDLRVVVPAFMISEIRRGFEIGFLIVLPFLVIDLIVATITMAMGMMMLPPTSISLPFKILFFVLIDGWNLLVGSLTRLSSRARPAKPPSAVLLTDSKETAGKSISGNSGLIGTALATVCMTLNCYGAGHACVTRGRAPGKCARR